MNTSIKETCADWSSRIVTQVKRAMEVKNMSISDLALKVDKPISVVESLLSGHANLTLEDLATLSNGVGVTITTSVQTNPDTEWRLQILEIDVPPHHFDNPRGKYKANYVWLDPEKQNWGEWKLERYNNTQYIYGQTCDIELGHNYAMRVVRRVQVVKYNPNVSWQFASYDYTGYMTHKGTILENFKKEPEFGILDSDFHFIYKKWHELECDVMLYRERITSTTRPQYSWHVSDPIKTVYWMNHEKRMKAFYDKHSESDIQKMYDCPAIIDCDGNFRINISTKRHPLLSEIKRVYEDNQSQENSSELVPNNTPKLLS